MGLWGGRFAEGSDPRFTAINDSLPVDARFVLADIDGSIVWAGAIGAAGVIAADDAEAIATGLRAIRAAVVAGELDPRTGDDEDIHAWVERELTARIGAVARTLHTGRSRNDQVATDLRLWLRSAIDLRLDELTEVQAALVRLAEREAGTVLPGYTHLQPAQPLLVGHWAMAFAEMFERDRERLIDARRRVNRSPLGAAALAGSGFPVDRVAIAAALGFDEPLANSLDAVSDRDVVIEPLGALSILAVHLSRLAEDLIFHASGEAGFVECGDAVSSGSSIMPQKKNPDALELVRGMSGPIVGSLVSLLVTMKGLPLAYDKDMQNDKAPLFAAMDAASGCLAVLPVILDGLVWDRERTREAARDGHANATELADALAERGVPFRDAHEIVGRAVRLAISRGVRLEDLTDVELTTLHPKLDASVRPGLELDAVLARREVLGGTAPIRVAEQTARWRAAIDAREPAGDTNAQHIVAGPDAAAVDAVRRSAADASAN